MADQMIESEGSRQPKITGQVIVDQKPDGRIWWIDQWTLPDGTNVYQRSVKGGVHGKQGPATLFDPIKIDPSSKAQQETAKQYQALMEKRKVKA